MTSEKELDKLIQIKACQQNSKISGLPAECGHHLISRSNILLRWDMDNILPVTIKEHNLIHAGKIDPWKYVNVTTKYYLKQLAGISFKNYLLSSGKTKQEFLEQMKKLLDVSE